MSGSNKRVAGVGLAVVFGVAACVPPSETIAVTRQRHQPYYRVTVVSAAIAATRIDGRPWHTQPPEHTWKVIGAIAGLFVGQPELGMTAGSMFDDQGGAFGPAPM